MKKKMKREVLELYDYQIDGVQQIIQGLTNTKAFLLCDEMGLGKTIQALESAKNLVNSFPVLIVAPSSCIHIWAEGDTKKFYSFKIQTFVGPKRIFVNSLLDNQTIVITSYDTLLNAYKNYIANRLDTGQMSNEELLRYCQVNDKDVSGLIGLTGEVYRRELLILCRGIPKQAKSSSTTHDFAFISYHWGLLIMDEIQKIKNPKGNRRAAIGFVNARYRLGLTGTPIMNFAGDLITIWKYGLGLFNLNYAKIYKDPNSDYCKEILDRTMLRRSKNQIEELKSVLPKRIKTDEVEILPWGNFRDQKNAYVACKNESLKMYHEMQAMKKGDSGKKSLNMSFIGKMQTLRQICLGILPAKDQENLTWFPSIHGTLHPWVQKRVCVLMKCLFFRVTCDKSVCFKIIREFVKMEQKLIQPSPKMLYVYKMLKEHRKLVVFSTFKIFLLNIMQPWLRQIEILSSVFCGGSRAHQQEALKVFKENPDIQVLLVVKTAGAEGLNLQELSNVCIIMDPHFNAALDEQAAQRIDRIGQKKEVIIRKLYMEGSVDEALKKMQENKLIDIEAWNTKNGVKTIKTHGLFLEKYDTVK